MPQDSTQYIGQEEEKSLLMPALAALIVVTAVAAGYFAFMFWGAAGTRGPQGTGITRFEGSAPKATDVRDSIRAGAYAQAISQHEELMRSAQSTSDDRAHAAWNVAGLRYKITGDVSSFIDDIHELKKAIEDSNASQRARVMALNSLASLYSEAGEHPQVFAAVYTTEPYQSFLVPFNTVRTTRNLLEWGYGSYPTSVAAAKIAGYYMKDALNASDLRDGDRAALREEAKRYMREARELGEKEAAARPGYWQSGQYGSVLFWGAFVEGALAVSEGAPYTETFDATYERLYQSLEAMDNKDILQYLGYAHWMHATFLLDVLEDKKKAAAQIEKAVAHVRSAEDISGSEFGLYLKNRYHADDLEADTYLIRNIDALARVSSSFTELLEDIRNTI